MRASLHYKSLVVGDSLFLTSQGNIQTVNMCALNAPPNWSASHHAFSDTLTSAFGTINSSRLVQ